MLILELKTVQANPFRILIEALKEFLTDVNIEITAHTAGDTYSIVTEWLKYYEF